MNEEMNYCNEFVLGDCLDVMKNLPEYCIDCVITDPPNLILNKHYSTRVWFNRSFGDLGVVEHFFKSFFKQLKRIIKSTGFIYIFCNDDSYPLFWYYTYPFTKNVRTIIWDKITSFNGYSWRHQHELILYAELPNSPVIKTGDGDILRCRSVKVKDRNHPAEKPEEIIKKLMLKSTQEGEIVADFFAGNATTLRVAKRLNRNYFGVEYDKQYYLKGLNQLKKDISILDFMKYKKGDKNT